MATVLPGLVTLARFRPRWGTATTWAMVDKRGLWLAHGESGAFSLVQDLARVTALDDSARRLLDYVLAQDATQRLTEEH